MTVFYYQQLNRTRATSSWSDEPLMIESVGFSGGGQLRPTPARGLFSFCRVRAEALVHRFLGQLHHQLEQTDGQMLSRNLAEAPNTQTMANRCDLIRSDTRGRKRFKPTLASRSFLARRFQNNQGALPPVEFDRVCDARGKQSP